MSETSRAIVAQENTKTINRQTLHGRRKIMKGFSIGLLPIALVSIHFNVVTALQSGTHLHHTHATRQFRSTFVQKQSLQPLTTQRRFTTITHLLPPTKTSQYRTTPPSTNLITTSTTLKSSLDNKNDEVYQDSLRNTFRSITFSSVFGLAIWYFLGPIPSQEFFAGYLVEQSLSLDNLFVFLLLFEYFRVPLEHQNRVLNWGIFGAVAMRGIMISLGSVALKNFHGVLLIFAAVLVYSSGKMIVDLASDDDEEDEDMGENSIVKFSRRLLPTTDQYDGNNFFTLVDGVKTATPLLLCLVAVEISDVIFAVDSVPAVFGITEDPFIVFTSNICAILGLRSIYTILSKAASDLKYLEPAVAVVLGFIGVKLILEYFGIIIPVEASLITVAGLLSTGVGLSIAFPENDEKTDDE